MIDVLEKKTFTPLLNDFFEVYPVGMEKVEVELVQVTDKSNDFSEEFSLLFRGPKESVFPHNTHRMKHPEIGEFDINISRNERPHITRAGIDAVCIGNIRLYVEHGSAVYHISTGNSQKTLLVPAFDPEQLDH